MKILKSHSQKSKQNKGFTLIELLVTITIFVILTGVVLFSQTGFNNTILLKNLAYDISLTVRQAQNYGVDVNESKLISNPFAPFGVYFNLNTSSGSAYNFVFFNDVLSGSNSGSNSKYDYAATGKINLCNDSECIQPAELWPKKEVVRPIGKNKKLLERVVFYFIIMGSFKS